MQIKTHLTAVLFFIMFFLSIVGSKIIFILITLAATFIPDADTKFSTLGKRKTLRPVQLFTKHRGIFHSFSILFLITAVFVLFLPIAALPFFLGYGLHLFLDSFTIDGIAPFYPSKKRIYGKVRNGSNIETFIFISFIIADFAILFLKFFNT